VPVARPSLASTACWYIPPWWQHAGSSTARRPVPRRSRFPPPHPPDRPTDVDPACAGTWVPRFSGSRLLFLVPGLPGLHECNLRLLCLDDVLCQFPQLRILAVLQLDPRHVDGTLV